MHKQWAVVAFIVIVRTGYGETPVSPAAEEPADQESNSPSRRLPTWLKMGAELRGRLEGLSGIGFVPDEQDTYYLHRFRLNATVKISPHVRTVIQVQDSHAPSHRCKPAPPNLSNTLDLRLAYLEAGPEEGTPWTARVGRQPLVFGDLRLVSTSNWGNVGPAYDGVRVSYASSGVKLDWFASTVVTPVAGQFDRPRTDRRLHGFYSAFHRGPGSTSVEAYLFWKNNLFAVLPYGPSGHQDVYTLGTHAFGKLPLGFDYNVEVAMQTGHIAQSGVQAWAGHWETSHATGNASWRPRLIAQYRYATGDRDPQDAMAGTFDNLYPGDKFGTADGIAWRNIHEGILGAEWRPSRKWRTKLAYHAFWLASREDALYATGGAVLAHNPAAASARVGSELDLRVIYQRDSHLQFFAGYGYFFAGPYIKQSTQGAGTHYPYVMWSYTF